MASEITQVNVQSPNVAPIQKQDNCMDSNCRYIINNLTSETDKFEYVTRAKKGKKFCIGLLSLTPGLGYFANGQFGKMLLTQLGIGAGGTLVWLGAAGALASNKALGAITAICGGALALGTYIASIVGSVKNADKNVEIIKRTTSNDGFVTEARVNTDK